MPQGIQGAMFQMISHGIVSGALFLCVGVVYDRMHTREIAAYGGLVNRMPIYAVIFMVFTMANVGLPGTSGFVGEFLTLMGAFRANDLGRLPRHDGRHPVGLLCALALPPVIFGELEKPSAQVHHGPRRREVRDPDPAGRADDLLRHPSGPGAGRFRRLHRCAAEEHAGCPRRCQDGRAGLALRIAQCLGSLAAVPAFGPATPEILLAASAIVFILWGAFTGERRRAGSRSRRCWFCSSPPWR
jgi:hypothetical protein